MMAKTAVRKGIPATLILVMALLNSSFRTDPAEIRKLTAETNHSTLMFSVPIAGGITRITGKFNDYSIDIDYVDDNWTKSKISAVIKAESIDTGIDGRDEHLRTADFFETASYPEITFTSERIERTDSGYTAYGKFSMHGVTRTIEFPFVVTGEDGDHTIGISSRLSINRLDFGVGSDFKHTAVENFLGEEIAIEIDFWTKKRKEPGND
jgi:polyisoprenoid-binding protein YceI